LSDSPAAKEGREDEAAAWAIVDRLHAETARALDVPTVRKRLTTLGMEPMPMNSAEFDAQVRKELEITAALVKAIGMRPN
jgi:tripartite-type tricarboxylate transporter receptor subunit TctC